MGVELFQIDTFDPQAAAACPADPIQIALGIMRGELDPMAATGLNPAAAKIGCRRRTESPVVAPL